MSSVPEDVYLDIFTRLSVKSLLTCKCVCKFWCYIISSPGFVKKHLNHAKERNNTGLMFTAFDLRTRCFATYTKGYDLISSSRILCKCDDAVERDHPLEPDCAKLLGSCNGLVYFWVNRKQVSCIWNPATTEYRIMANTSKNYKTYDISMYGFGYDCKIDDYKIIRVVNIYDRCIFDVYTLGTNSWKSCETMLDVKVFLQAGVTVNGDLHWSAVKWGKASNKIISWDISNEKFKTMEPPKEVSENTNSWMNVGELEGLLCVIDDAYMAQLQVWVMHEYGVQESWTKRYIIKHENFKKFEHLRVYHENPIKYNHCVKPIWQFDKGEILFSRDETDEKLVLYDPKQETSRKLEMQGLSYVVKYFESLVSVRSGTYVEGIKKLKKRKILFG